ASSRLFPYTTLFRSAAAVSMAEGGRKKRASSHVRARSWSWGQASFVACPPTNGPGARARARRREWRRRPDQTSLVRRDSNGCRSAYRPTGGRTAHPRLALALAPGPRTPGKAEEGARLVGRHRRTEGRRRTRKRRGCRA